MTFFKNCLHVGLQFCSDDGSVGLQALAAAKACAINSVTINSTGVGCVRGRWLTGCMQGRYSDMASVSLSN